MDLDRPPPGEELRWIRIARRRERNVDGSWPPATGRGTSMNQDRSPPGEERRWILTACRRERNFDESGSLAAGRGTSMNLDRLAAGRGTSMNRDRSPPEEERRWILIARCRVRNVDESWSLAAGPITGGKKTEMNPGRNLQEKNSEVSWSLAAGWGTSMNLDRSPPDR